MASVSRRPARPLLNRQHPFMRVLMFGVVSLILIGVLLLAVTVFIYTLIVWQLPSADELSSRSYQFATTQILDREGGLLWEIIDPNGGRRTHITLSHVSPDLINATLATEDRYFFLNVGVDPIAIIRASYTNLTEGQIVSGASTITQQLARNVFLTPEERLEKSFSRKLREAVLAVEINRRYTKAQILETYLNQTYYGNLAYGIEAAAQTYFGKSARDLTLPEAALLAGLPQSPRLYNPYLYFNQAKARQAEVLELMVEAGYISQSEADAAKETSLVFRNLAFDLKAPHFVSVVRQELEAIVPPAYLYQAGLKVYTTLDPRLQTIAEEEIKAQVTALSDRQVTNGALLALNVTNGEILALVGSADFRDESIEGQVNMVTTPRQPGSTMKPLTYLAAFERLDWTPSTLLMDTPVTYPDDTGQVYRPRNADDQFHGPVSLRTALANSYNIPAVKTLEQVGVEALKEMAARLGITTLTHDYYGLSLTLGSGEVPLIEMTGAYQAIANGGLRLQPTSILKITDSFGREVEPVRPPPQRVLHEAHAYLITHILADNDARTPAFGPDSPLRLSRPAAVKTGTTNDFRDNWAIGYTPDIVTGVWVGNADNRPMIDVGGASGAAPIWHGFMERAHENLPVRDFTRPPEIVELEVCADSGTLPSADCPERRKEIFFRDQPPLGPEHDMHRRIEIDGNTGLLVNEYCRSNIEQRYYRVFPPDGRDWALSHGIEQPPTEFCPSAHLVARITHPVNGIAVRGVIALEGTAVAPKFSYYQLELGSGTQPQTFTRIQSAITRQVRRSLLADFDTTQLENGPYTLRLVVFDQMGGFTEDRLLILVDNPPDTIAIQAPVITPPPTYTPTRTPTPVRPVVTPTAITSTTTLTEPLTTTAPLTPTGAPPPAFLPGETEIQLFTPPDSEPLPLSGTPSSLNQN